MKDDKVVFLKFGSEKVREGFISIHSCVSCENKTFILVRRTPDTDETFPMLECAACGEHIGRIGWAED